jgi:hypothetical protein
VTVYLNRRHGAFRGTNPEVGWQYSATALDVGSAFRTTDKDDNDQPGRRRAQ